MKTMEIDEFCKIYNDTLKVIDVRTVAEYQSGHVQGAVNIPLDKIKDYSGSLISGNETIYLICQSGARSAKACAELHRLEILNAVSIAGGTQAARAAGLPISRPQNNMISLERQVRIAAGSLVLTGLLLAYLLSPYFILLSAFVGAGLVFSGVTDTCGLAYMLARLPWNKA